MPQAPAIVSLLCVLATVSLLKADEAQDLEYFEKHVRPLLVERCLKCHRVGGDVAEGSPADADSVGGNLRLDHREGWARGGDLGPAIVPGDPDQSLLVKAVRYTDDALQMPPDGKLSAREVAIFEEWVRRGAPDPRSLDAPATVPRKVDVDQGRQFWAFQLPTTTRTMVPEVTDRAWARTELDRFILADLEAHGLTPNPPADRRTLIRRATFDLTGLPPTPAEVAAFMQDRAPDAYERLIDRLLASPAYGERWGRHWLDVARYADSNGLDENIAHGNAWRYRDYVVRSLNGDKPYARFVMEQLAGDLLAAREQLTDAQRRDCLIATGFLSLGPKVLAEVDETKMEMDIIDEQIDTVGRALLGLTLGCARCHDHKFDPIRTEDYYALAGIFKSTRTMEHFTKIAKWNEVDLASADVQQRRDVTAAKVAELQAELKSLTEATDANDAGGEQAANNRSLADCKAVADCEKAATDPAAQKQRIERQIQQLQATMPPMETAMAVVDRAEPTDVRVHIRGSHLTLGDSVSRGVPAVVDWRDSPAATIPEAESGRWQLAAWLASEQHPLVARVIVNRVWRWHFGRGLVPSTDNFGTLGDTATNQPLLDWLAQQLIRDGWSLKQLHRRIMLSRTYCMSSDDDAVNLERDPENRYWWRTERRRLEAEAIRDALLFVSGTLDRQMGGSLLHVGNREFLFDHTSKDTTNYDTRRRSLYLPVVRNHLYDLFQLFDYTDASVSNSNRPTTTVPTQALFLMNSELVQQAAAQFAEELVRQYPNDTNGRIRRGYAVAFGRAPTEDEVALARHVVTQLQELGVAARRPPQATTPSVGDAAGEDDARQDNAGQNNAGQKSAGENGAGEREGSDEHVGSGAREEDAEVTIERMVWTVFCQTLLLSNEFIHVR